MSGGGWPEWLSLMLATLSGVIIGAGAGVKWMWKISDRVLSLEAKVGAHSVAESLRLDRHDHVYPMIQERIILPLDILEATVNQQGSSLAVLLDRDRIEEKIARLVQERRPHG